MAGSEVLFSKGDGLQPWLKMKELAGAVCYIEATSIDFEKGHQEIRYPSKLTERSHPVEFDPFMFAPRMSCSTRK